MSDSQVPWIPIHSATLTAEVNPLGAQLSVLRDRAGRDLLWGGDPSVWNGRAPLLFPIVGALANGTYRVGAASYALPRHGFARGRRFEVVTSASVATFHLEADATSLAVYPYHFALDVRFALEGPTLSIVTTVHNRGDVDMPASFGYHPALRWPLPYGQTRAAHFVEFEQDEPAPIRRLDAAGLLTPERHPTPIADRHLALTDSLFDADVVIFDSVRSRAVIFGALDGPRIRVAYPDAPYLGIWSKPGAPFVCIEPWHGIADPIGYAGDFNDKPGVFRLSPGASMPIAMTFTLLET